MASWRIAAAVALLTILATPAMSSLQGPLPPTAVSATTTAAGTIVSWLPPASDGGQPVLGYVVERRNINGLDGTWETLATVSAESFTDTQAPAGWTVYAVSTMTESGRSEPAMTATGPCEPIGTSTDFTPPFVHFVINKDCLGFLGEIEILRGP